MEHRVTKLLSSQCGKQSSLLSSLLVAVHVTALSVTRRGGDRIWCIPFEKCNMFSLSHHSCSHHDGLKHKAIDNPQLCTVYSCNTITKKKPIKTSMSTQIITLVMPRTYLSQMLSVCSCTRWPTRRKRFLHSVHPIPHYSLSLPGGPLRQNPIIITRIHVQNAFRMLTVGYIYHAKPSKALEESLLPNVGIFV